MNSIDQRKIFLSSEGDKWFHRNKEKINKEENIHNDPIIKIIDDKNISLKNLKSKLKSTTNEYAEKLIKEINNNNFDIVEIHNRPQLLFKLIDKVQSKFIFYFHNDPLSMKGSK